LVSVQNISVASKKKKKKKSFKKTFIGFCRRKLNKGKLDQINSKLAQIWESDYWGPNRTTYLFWGQLDIVCFGLKLQVNWSLGRHLNTGQQRLYKFCYLLPFDLWTFYLAIILFLKRCGNLFLKSTNSTKIFNGLQHSFQVWQGFIIISESS